MRGHDFSESAEISSRELVAFVGEDPQSPFAVSQVVLACVSTAEVYVDGALEALVDVSGIKSLRIGDFLIGQQRLEAIGWEERFKWLSKGFGLQLMGEKVGQEFRSLVALRNGLAHGNGSLTRLQRREPVRQVSLESDLWHGLSVQVRRGQICLSPATADQAVWVSLAYIEMLDSAIVGMYPGIGL